MGHNPASVTYTERATPASVVFTERSAGASVWLEPLTAKERSDGFWLFLSGLADGTMFTKNAEDWQLLLGSTWLGADQRMGQEEDDDFVLLIEDNS